jgi:SAM-dependent methyltransferase
MKDEEDRWDNVTADIPFYVEYAEKHPGNILDLACGTGYISIELARTGYYITSLDSSELMLKMYRKEIKRLPQDIRDRITIVYGDMWRFNNEKRFSLILAPFRVFQELSEDDIKTCFTCIREHLDANGIFILTVFRPYKMPNGTWRYDEEMQRNLHEKKNEDTEKYYTYFDLRFRYYHEYLLYMLKENGFQMVEEYGWYDKSPVENGRELIVISVSK